MICNLLLARDPKFFTECWKEGNFAILQDLANRDLEISIRAKRILERAKRRERMDFDMEAHWLYIAYFMEVIDAETN